MRGPDYGKRLASLREALSSKGLDGVVLSSLNDIYYYTGKALSRGDSGFLLVTRKSKTLFVSSLNNELEGPGVKIMNDWKRLKQEFQKAGRLGYDERNLTVFLFRKLRSGPWRPFSQELKALRMVKDSYEITQLSQAAWDTLAIIKSLMIGGKTEYQLASEIHQRIRKMGKEPAFDPLVAAGRNSAYIHHIPGSARILKGLVLVDMGVRHNHYNADVTRMFALEPNRTETKMLDECISLQTELIDMTRPGVAFSSIQKRHENRLKALGFKAMHSFGHGLGLGVHERPQGRDVLQNGMVITVEPGIYKKGVGGCRVEDMVLVRDRPVVLSS